MLPLLLLGYLVVMLPAACADDQPCFFSSHDCCSLPNINGSTIDIIFETKYVNETIGQKWVLDVVATWAKPDEEASYGYGLCLHIPPYHSPGAFSYCRQVDSPERECNYQLTNRTVYTHQNVLFGYSYYYLIRVIQLDVNGSYEYLAPNEEAIEIITPDCYEETGDREYCHAQPILYASKPTDVMIDSLTRVNDTLANVGISWREPAQFNASLIEFRVVAMHFDDTTLNQAQSVPVTEGQRSNGANTSYSLIFEGLLQNSSYTITIDAAVKNGREYGHMVEVPLYIPILEPTTTLPPKHTTFLPADGTSPTMKDTPVPGLGTAEIIAIVLGTLIALVIAVVIIVVILKKRGNEKDDSVFMRESDGTMIRPTTTKSALVDFEKEVEPAFVDIEIDRSRLKIEDELGSGQFGVVYKGFALGLGEDKEEYTPVAVKGLKKHANRATKEDFLDEIKLIIEIGTHPNILAILGCITVDEPYYLVTEFMKYGDLLHFLWKCREEKYKSMDPVYNISDVIKTQIAHQIARGMDYLSKTRYYHGDLAARNVLVGEDLAVKISDFGMADDIYMRGYKRLAPERKRPVKWVSLETNTTGKCSIESDVWSFGIVLYEIYTLGGAPYPAMDGRMILDKLLEGYRMERPEECPNDVYNVMRKCWQEKPEERPTFNELYIIFDKILSRTSDYFDMEDDDTPYDNGVDDKNKSEMPQYAGAIVKLETHVPRSRSNSYVDMKDKATSENPTDYVTMANDNSTLADDDYDTPKNNSVQVEVESNTPNTYVDMKEKTKARRQQSDEYVVAKTKEHLAKTGNVMTEDNDAFESDTYF